MTYLMMISTYLRNLRQDEKGVTAVEYALIAALIVGVIYTMVGNVGTDVLGAFTTVDGAFKG